MKTNTFKKQGGFSLVEIAIVIVIIIGVLLAAFKLLPNIQRQVKVTDEMQNIGTLITNLHNTYGGRYAALTDAAAINFGSVVPTEMVNGTTLAGNFGTVTLAPSTLLNGAASTAVQITLQNVPQIDCTQIAPALLGIAAELDVGGTTVKNANTPTPLTSTVATACGTTGVVNIALRAN